MTATSPEVPSGADRGLGNPVAALGRLLGVSEGRAYTIIIGLVVASLLAVFGIPQTLGHVTPVAAPGPAAGAAGAPPQAARRAAPPPGDGPPSRTRVGVALVQLQPTGGDQH